MNTRLPLLSHGYEVSGNLLLRTEQTISKMVTNVEGDGRWPCEIQNSHAPHEESTFPGHRSMQQTPHTDNQQTPNLSPLDGEKNGPSTGGEHSLLASRKDLPSPKHQTRMGRLENFPPSKSNDFRHSLDSNAPLKSRIWAGRALYPASTDRRASLDDIAPRFRTQGVDVSDVFAQATSKVQDKNNEPDSPGLLSWQASAPKAVLTLPGIQRSGRGSGGSSSFSGGISHTLQIASRREAARRSMDMNSRQHTQSKSGTPCRSMELQSRGDQTSAPEKNDGRCARNNSSSSNDSNDPTLGCLRKAITEISLQQPAQPKKPKQVRLNKSGNRRLVTSMSMKNYLSAFQGMSIAKDGTVKLADFLQHVRENAPSLEHHATSMFDALSRKAQRQGWDVEKKGLDFGALLKVLFPGSSSHDITMMIDMCRRVEKPAVGQTEMLGMLDEAKYIFDTLDVNDSGFLSRAEAERGMPGDSDVHLTFTEHDLEELFGRVGTSTERQRIQFPHFFGWYSEINGITDLANG